MFAAPHLNDYLYTSFAFPEALRKIPPILLERHEYGKIATLVVYDNARVIRQKLADSFTAVTLYGDDLGEGHGNFSP